MAVTDSQHDYMKWDSINERFGFRIPEPFLTAVEANAFDSECFSVLPIDEILSLEHLSPSMPPRFLPLAVGNSGEFVGFYVPLENEGSAFLAIGSINDTFLNPLPGDSSLFPIDPDQCDKYLDDVTSALDLDLSIDPLWESLAIRQGDETSPHFKPFCINRTAIGDCGMPGYVQSMPSLSEAFRAADALFSVPRWVALAQRLISDDQPELALRAFSNAHLLLWHFPHHGFPGEQRDNWNEARILFFEMRKLTASSDKFDRVTIDHQCEHFDEWIQEASGG